MRWNKGNKGNKGNKRRGAHEDLPVIRSEGIHKDGCGGGDLPRRDELHGDCLLVTQTKSRRKGWVDFEEPGH